MTPEEVKAKLNKMSEVIAQLRIDLRALEPHIPTEHADIILNASEALTHATGDVNLLSILV
jgi:hypothetical protein